MKNKLAQFSVLASKIEPRYIQLAYSAFVLAGFVVTQAPVDGGGGPH